jgi:type IV secretory pathway VirD2 relaxase
MLMLIENLGRDYIVWDKAASIRFRRPGRGTVRAQFRLTEEQIQEIRESLRDQEKIDRTFSVEVRDESGTVIAEVQKVIHVKGKAALSATANVADCAWRENRRSPELDAPELRR